MTSKPAFTNSTKQEVVIFRGKDEMNLCEFPFARLGKKDTRESIVCETWVKDKLGNSHNQVWEIRAAAGLGLPTEFAERVYVALLAITSQQQYSKKVYFSVYRLLKLMGLECSKPNYQYVEKALDQLAGVTVYSKGAFWDKTERKRVSSKKAFHIIEQFWLRTQGEEGEVLGDAEEQAQAYIVWSDRIWNSFQAGYIKNLDIDFFYSLQNIISRRLYRFLDKRFYNRDEYEIDIFDLASRLGMVQYSYPSEVKKKLRPALDELVQNNFLCSADTVKRGKFTRVKFVKNTREKQFSKEWERVISPENQASGFLEERQQVDAVPMKQDFVSEYQDVWDEVLLGLKAQLSDAIFFSFVSKSTLVSIENGTAKIALGNAAAIDWVGNRLENQMRRLLNISLREAGTEEIKSIELITFTELLTASQPTN